MIKFVVDRFGVVMVYVSLDQNSNWVSEELKNRGEVTISRVFTMQQVDLIEGPSEDPDTGELLYKFRFATSDGTYHRIKGRVFGIQNEVQFAVEGIKLERRLFAAERNVSIFRRLAKVVGPSQAIAVGGEKAGRIPVDVFEALLKKFPNSSELDRYANARVSNILGEYFDGMKDFRAQYETYLSRRKSVISDSPSRPEVLLRGEIDKFVFIRETIALWLNSSEGRTEKEWQKMILKFILLVFPKYVAVLENVKIEDHYSKPGAITDRFIDIALVDANGNIDVIEIKRPFDDVLLAKTPYRDNFVPTKDLSGTIMQAEKYLLHLSKWGIAGEAKLTKNCSSQLPPGMSIRITNPKAILLLGRDRNPDGSAALDAGQKFDLEVIKRKYANMMDIITYDDLLRRLDNIIASLRGRAGDV